MEYKDSLKAIKIIIDNDDELQAIRLLLDSVERKTNKVNKENAEMRASLRAIKKINKNKNEAIANLCELEGGESDA